MKILGKSFKENFNLGQNVSVDEAMVKRKRRNPMKQYVKQNHSKGDQSCGALVAPVVHTCGISNCMQVKKIMHLKVA